MSELEPPPPVLHLFALPKNDEYLRAQKKFAENHKWFRVHRLDAKTHFLSLEDPETVSAFIKDFIG
ncbi:MAG: hypothetical protein QXE96_07475 [Candidatus Caldarchaeum sp.]